MVFKANFSLFLFYSSLLPISYHHHPQGVGWFSNKQTLSCKIAGLPWGPSIKDVGIFWAIFDTPLPHVGISTLIC